jgi:hypothetical protein
VNELALTSSVDGEELRVTMEPNPGFDAHWTAHLRTSALTARTTVSADASHWDSMISFFENLAEHWDGWEGDKAWNPDEGIAFRATHDGRGHALVWVTVRAGPEFPDDWVARAPLSLEAQRLYELGQQLRAGSK